MKLIESVILPIELCNRNDGQGHAYFRTNVERHRIEKTLRAVGHSRQVTYAFPVRLVLVRILGPKQRLWDYDSGLRGNAKQLLDSLVALKWFRDDSPKWIEAVHFRQDAGRRDEGPATELRIYEGEEQNDPV